MVVREGWKFILPAAVAAAGGFAGLGIHWVSLACLLCLITLVVFFRRPAGPPATLRPEDILSPAGGFVIEVVEENEPAFLKAAARRISIFMTPLDVHVNTAPVDGMIRYADYRRGTFFKADRPEARLQNERMIIGIERADGKKCLAIQVAGWLARRIICDVSVGDEVRRGHRYGLIQFGSRMDLYLPAEATVRVNAGQHVRAAKTVLAQVP